MSSEITTETCDKGLTVKSLINLRKNNNDGKEIKIILDNANYNRAYLVQNKAKKLNIDLIYNLPYCPNLNLIKRAWTFLN